MADFSAQSASLPSSTSGVGSPVVESKVSEPTSNIGSGVAALAGMLGKGADAYINAQMIKAKNGILGSISQQQSAINDAVATGQMNDQEAHVKSMSVYNRALAAYPQFASEIQGLNAAFKATTETGDTDKLAQNRIDEAQKIRDQENTQAINQGFHIDPNMTDGQRGAIINASQAAVAARTQLQDQERSFQFQKTQVGWSQEQEDRQRKFQTVQLLTNLGGKNMEAFDATLQSLVDDVKAGRKTPEDAAAIYQQQYGGMSGTLAAAAGVNPEMAAPWRSIIDSKYQLGLKMLDPKSNTDALQREYQDGVNKVKLLMFNSDPQVQKVVGASQMLGPNNPILIAASPPATIKAMATLISTPTTQGVSNGFVTPVVGNPEVEKDALNSLKAGIDQLRGGKVADKMQGNTEGTNAVNNLLIQTGQLMNQGGMDASKMKGIADFFASSQYAYMMQHGAIDPQANQMAKNTFQKIYEPAIVQAVGNKMQDAIPNTKLKAINAVDANFTAAGVSFSPRKGLSPEDSAATQSYIDQNLKSSAMGMNTALRVGAHMEGTIDYQKYWNDNKYILMPQLYPVKPKQTINGMQWSGEGDWRDPTTWKRANGGQQ